MRTLADDINPEIGLVSGSAGEGFPPSLMT